MTSALPGSAEDLLWTFLRIVADATCLLLPSLWYEGFPRTIVEAFACGTPVIASRLGSMIDLIDDGRTGLLFEPGNAGDLVTNIRQLFGQTLPENMPPCGPPPV